MNGFFKSQKAYFHTSTCLILLVLIVVIGKGNISAAEKKSSVGKKAAHQYFVERKKIEEKQKVVQARGSESRLLAQVIEPRVLAIHFGTFLDQEVDWGFKENEEVVAWTTGVTYKVGEWINLMDLYGRVDVTSFRLVGNKGTRISFLPVIAFPDAKSGFPLYFGGGAGLGAYIDRVFVGESFLSFDYQLLAGVRLFKLFGEAGFIFETGLKNQILLFSDGQLKSVFAAVGVIFSF